MEDSQINEMKKTWRERSQRNMREEIERKNKAKERAQKIALYLKDKYKVKAVYLFGSLIWGKHFTASSDIDLLIIDFPENEDYWEALSAVEHIAMPFPVSLVLSGSADPGLNGKVRKEGLLL